MKNLYVIIFLLCFYTQAQDDNFEDYSKKPEYEMIQLGTRWRIRENKYSQLVFEQNISLDLNKW